MTERVCRCVCVGGCGGMCGENINGAVMITALSPRTNVKLRQRSADIFLFSFSQFQIYLDTLAALLMKNSHQYCI